MDYGYINRNCSQYLSLFILVISTAHQGWHLSNDAILIKPAGLSGTSLKKTNVDR